MTTDMDTEDPNQTSGEKRFPVLLRSAWFGLNKSFRRRLVEHGLTPVQFIVLRWLSESEPGSLTQKDLAQMISSNPNNVADLVARMEKEGWLRRKVGDGDARSKQLFLTSKGAVAYAGARGTATALQREVLAELDDAERETFLALLDRVAGQLDHLAKDKPSMKPNDPGEVAAWSTLYLKRNVPIS